MGRDERLDMDKELSREERLDIAREEMEGHNRDVRLNREDMLDLPSIDTSPQTLGGKCIEFIVDTTVVYVYGMTRLAVAQVKWVRFWYRALLCRCRFSPTQWTVVALSPISKDLISIKNNLIRSLLSVMHGLNWG